MEGLPRRSVLLRMAVKGLTLAIAVVIASGLAFYPALWLPRRARSVAMVAVLAAIALAPMLLPTGARVPRLAAMLVAVTVGVKLYDESANAAAGFRPGPWLFVVSLLNPFALVLRRVLAEPPRPRGEDMARAITFFVIGASAAGLLIGAFHVDWRRHPFVIEHCFKATSLFLMIQFLPNALASMARLMGIPSTDFAGPFFLARTPAEFWRDYNRPAGQFLNEYVFKPAGGCRRPVLGMVATFVVSGIIHEYVFDVPAGRVLGSQMLFFGIQGLAVIATWRVRPRGWIAAVPMVLLTFAFNLATVRIFLAALNAVGPFYAQRP